MISLDDELTVVVEMISVVLIPIFVVLVPIAVVSCNVSDLLKYSSVC